MGVALSTHRSPQYGLRAGFWCTHGHRFHFHCDRTYGSRYLAGNAPPRTSPYVWLRDSLGSRGLGSIVGLIEKRCQKCNRGPAQQRTVFWDPKAEDYFCEIHAREATIPINIVLPTRYGHMKTHCLEFIKRTNPKPRAIITWYKRRGVTVKLDWVNREYL